MFCQITDLKELEIVSTCFCWFTIFLDQPVTAQYLIKVSIGYTDILLKICQICSRLTWLLLKISHLYGGYHMVSWHSHALLMALLIAAGVE